MDRNARILVLRVPPFGTFFYISFAFSNELLGLELGLGKPQATRIFDKSLRVLRWSENRETNTLGECRQM